MRTLESSHLATTLRMRRLFAQPADETPLAWRTVGAIQLFSVASTAATTALFSIAYFMARHFDRELSEHALALRAGVLTSIKPAASAVSAFAWGAMGDRFGFARIIALSGAAHAAATVAFGFSASFGAACALRAVQGCVDGMVVMQKPALALVSDGTNAARAFATTGVAYGTASAFAPALSALLAEPCTSWARFERDAASCPKLLARYPFFLSNVWILALALPALVSFWRGWLDVDDADEDVVVELELLSVNDDDSAGSGAKDGASKCVENQKIVENQDVPWFRDVNVKTAIASQVGCTFVVLTGAETTPLWMATSIQSGGLGWTSVDIGLFGTVMGFTILFFQIFLFTKLVRRFGIVTLLPFALAINAVVFPLHPIAHELAKRSKSLAWAVVIILGFARGMSGPIIMGGSSLILNNASPRRALGAVNGFSGTFSNAGRAIAPLLGGALVAMMVSMKPSTPGRTVWPFMVISLGFLSLTLYSRKLSLELNKPRAR
jgi:MFS family permease